MASVLWLDDEADRMSFETIEEVLEESGFSVVRVISVGEAAKELFGKRAPYDVLLLDVLMSPEGRYTSDATHNGTTTGLRFLEEVNAQRPDILVIVVTITEEAESLGLVGAGANVAGWLKKPFLPHDLVKEIVEVVRLKRSRDLQA